MSFPSSAEMSAFLESLRFDGLRTSIEECRPDLVGRVAVATGPTIKIELPPRADGYGRAVVAGVVKRVGRPHWFIIAPLATSFSEVVWPVDSSDELIVSAVCQTYDAALDGEQPSSPWRWQQHSSSTIVRVADRLVELGMDVTAVIEENRLAPDALEGARAPGYVDLTFGDALRVDLGWGAATLARKPTLGWVLDVNDHLVTRRMDLGLLATEVVSSSPGFESDDSAVLARGVVRARQARWEIVEGHISDARWDFTHPLLGAAAWWLTELGHGPAEVVDFDTPVVRGSHHVVVSTKRGGLGAVQRAFADASLDGLALAMFSTSGFTKDATAWADRAHALLFSLDRESLQIYPASRLASESLPATL